MHIFADGFSRLSMSNNNIRIVLTQNGPDNTQEEVATLVMPVNVSGNFVNGLVNSLKQLDEQMKARAEAQAEADKSDVQ